MLVVSNMYVESVDGTRKQKKQGKKEVERVK